VPRSGLVGVEAAIDSSLTWAASSGGAPSTSSKNARPGSGRAKLAMSSHSPSSTNSSISRVTSARVGASWVATAAGVNHGVMTRLYSRCSGGSTCSGMAFTTMALVPGTETPCSEL